MKDKVAVFNFSSNSGGSSTISNTLIHVLSKEYVIDEFSVYGSNKRIFLFNKLLHRFDNLLSLIFFSTYKNVSINCIPTFNANFVNKLESDIIHFHWIHFNFFSFWDFPKINKPVVWTLHDSWIVNNFSHLDIVEFCFFPRILNFLNRNKFRCINNSNFVYVCPSLWLYNKIKKSNLFDIKKFHHIYNPIDIVFWQNLSYSKKTYTDTNSLLINVLFVSNELNTNLNKGFSMLELIADFSKKSKYKLVFHIVCPISDYDSINTDYNFVFYGRVDKFKLRDLYCKSDLLVLPSLIENLPTVLIESISCSLPVVAHNTGGVCEIVEDGVNGRLIENYNSVSFYDAIVDVKKNLSRFKSNCRESVEFKFSYNNALNSYSNLYKSMLNDISSNSC
jgi:glycosyltransferase involved in cell wall biosynthesis